MRAALSDGSLCLATGVFSVRVHSTIPSVADALGLLYADYPVEVAAAYADFYIHLRRPRGLRRWLRPQVEFDIDGAAPFLPLPLPQAFPMFEWASNWCISSRAHTYLIIHAAAVEKGGRVAILPAPSGSGKSTLCAALVCSGWRLLSDELTLVRLADGAIQPVPRPVSLKNASIKVIRGFAPGAVLTPEVADTAKGTIAHLKVPRDSVLRALDTARPGCIVFPRYVANADLRMEPVARARAFTRVAENCFNYGMLGRAGFSALGTLADTAPAYDVSYGRLDDALALFERLADWA
ncbi:HprK-related kinase A [Massilia yuzhufengensis]|nr:HprK-related kinase A [Massilia yuzhufengensis]